jgi:hypothetical protein
MTAAAKVPAQRTTRRPTGLPSWPILLIAGWEKAGKSWSCAEASGSEFVGRTLWIGIGEDDPDDYANVPGADFEIVEHDGTYRDILAAIEWACAQPDVDGKPTLVVVDSMTRLWDLLCDMAQDMANARAAKKSGSRNSDEEADIHTDLWNIATGRWGHVMDALRSHRGPVLLTARLDDVTVMKNGKPTSERQWKVKAQKMLPYDVAGIVQLPERGKAFLTGVKTTRMNVPERIPLPGFAVDKLWRQLGLGENTSRERHHSGIDRSNVDPNAAQRALLLAQIKTAVNADNNELRRIAREWAETHDGQNIAETTDIGGLQLLCDDLAAAAERRQADAEVPA